MSGFDRQPQGIAAHARVPDSYLALSEHWEASGLLEWNSSAMGLRSIFMHVHQGSFFYLYHLQIFTVILLIIIWMTIFLGYCSVQQVFQMTSTQQNVSAHSCLVAYTDDSQISRVFAAFVARQG